MNLSIILNILIICLEVYIILSIKKTKDVFRYYTFYQNLIALLSSIFYLMIYEHKWFGVGVRYMSTTGLITASLIYYLYLSKNKKNHMSKKDFKSNMNPKYANTLLHIVIPIISTISLVFFETGNDVSEIWTMLAPIPSIIYMILYLTLSKLKIWNEPYHIEIKNKYISLLSIIFIPFIFIIVSYILWMYV